MLNHLLQTQHLKSTYSRLQLTFNDIVQRRIYLLLVAEYILRGRSQTKFTRRGGYVVQKCQLLEGRNCQWRGVHGQKSQTLVNVVCVRHFKPQQALAASLTSELCSNQ